MRQKIMVFFSLLLSGLVALMIEVVVPGFKIVFEGLGAHLPTFTQFIIEWHYIFSASAFLPQLLVYLLCRRYEKLQKKLVAIMLVTTLLWLAILIVFFSVERYSPIFSTC